MTRGTERMQDNTQDHKRETHKGGVKSRVRDTRSTKAQKAGSERATQPCDGGSHFLSLAATL